ncbi:MAG: family 16 glycoside hydrolase [Planctomycetaceae bacterium]
MRHPIAVLSMCCLCSLLIQTGAAEDREWPVLVDEHFDGHQLSGWAATDPGAWRLEVQGEGHVLHQFQQSRVQTPVRSPFNRCMLRGHMVGDFQLDVDVQSTARDYPHRSLCLFFGYQDPAHFYYVHLGQRADDHANQIFIVNEAPRTRISTKTTAGTPWDNEWHHVRITRDASRGSIAVFFDDLQTPVMTAADTTFAWGEVGLGSFDDTGRFDNVVLRGRAVATANLKSPVVSRQ